jgi:hypothetical protein
LGQVLKRLGREVHHLAAAGDKHRDERAKEYHVQLRVHCSSFCQSIATPAAKSWKNNGDEEGSKTQKSSAGVIIFFRRVMTTGEMRR